MTKAKRAMKEDIKLIDLIIEVVDARVPLASRNPDIDELGKGKARLILLNKSDLSSERYNEAWTSWFKEKGYFVVKINSRSGAGIKQINGVVQEACKEKIERDRRRGIMNRPVRAMVVGIPNVGKSTFINSFAGKACAKTGNKPGVTKGNQWIRLNKTLELLDKMPHSLCAFSFAFSTLVFFMKTRNSSPPTRPTKSSTRNWLLMRLATSMITVSPNVCPKLSLIPLKLSISIKNMTLVLDGFSSIYDVTTLWISSLFKSFVSGSLRTFSCKALSLSILKLRPIMRTMLPISSFTLW